MKIRLLTDIGGTGRKGGIVKMSPKRAAVFVLDGLGEAVGAETLFDRFLQEEKERYAKPPEPKPRTETRKTAVQPKAKTRQKRKRGDKKK